MPKRFFYLSVVLILLFAFAACSVNLQEPDKTTAPSASAAPSPSSSASRETLDADEFSFYLNGKEAVKLDPSNGYSHIDMKNQNVKDQVSYSTKRELSIGDSAEELLSQYGDLYLRCYISQNDLFQNKGLYLKDKTSEFSKEYQTARAFIENESNMNLTDDQMIAVYFVQYVDGANAYAGSDEDFSFMENMTSEEKAAYTEKMSRYDCCIIGFGIKGGKIMDIMIDMVPKEEGSAPPPSSSAGGETLDADEFSFYSDGKEAVKLDGSIDRTVASMVTKNAQDNVRYSTKRGLGIGDSAADVLKKYGDLSLAYSILSDQNSDPDIRKKAANYQSRYKTIEEYVGNESNMVLSDDECIFIYFYQYTSGSTVYSGVQADKKLGFNLNMTNKERKAYLKKAKQYDQYSIGFCIRNGKIIDIWILVDPKYK